MEIDIKKKLAEQRKSKNRETAVAVALVSPYFILFILFGLIPVVMGIVFSFMRYNPYMPGDNGFVGLQNYINIFNTDLPISKTFWESFTTMLLFGVVTVPLLTIIQLVLAYLINLQPPGYKFFRAVIYLPSVVSLSIMGIIFGNMFAGNSSGLINALFGTEIEWLSGRPWEGDTLRWVVMLIASIWWQTGTSFIIFAGALKNVPKVLYEACEMDGGSRWRRILAVTLPNIKSSVALCTFNSLIGYLGLFGQPYVLNDLTNESILVSPMMFIMEYLQGGVVYARQTGYLCACAIVFGLIVMICSIIQRRVMGEHNRKIKCTPAATAFFEDREYLSREDDKCKLQK